MMDHVQLMKRLEDLTVTRRGERFAAWCLTHRHWPTNRSWVDRAYNSLPSRMGIANRLEISKLTEEILRYAGPLRLARRRKQILQKAVVEIAQCVHELAAEKLQQQQTIHHLEAAYQKLVMDAERCLMNHGGPHRTIRGNFYAAMCHPDASEKELLEKRIDQLREHMDKMAQELVLAHAALGKMHIAFTPPVHRTCRVCGDGMRCKSHCHWYCTGPERHNMMQNGSQGDVCAECGCARANP